MELPDIPDNAQFGIEKHNSGISISGTIDHGDLQTGKSILLGSAVTLNTDPSDTRSPYIYGFINGNNSIYVKNSEGKDIKLGEISISNDCSLGRPDSNMEYILKITASNDELKTFASDVNYSFKSDKQNNDYWMIDDRMDCWKYIKGTTSSNPYKLSVIMPSDDTKSITITKPDNDPDARDLESYVSHSQPNVYARDANLTLGDSRTNDGDIHRVVKITADNVDASGKLVKGAFNSNNMQFGASNVVTYANMLYVTKDGKFIQEPSWVGLHLSDSLDNTTKFIRLDDNLDASEVDSQTPDNAVAWSMNPDDHSMIYSIKIPKDKFTISPNTLEDVLDNSYYTNLADVTKYGYSSVDEFKQAQRDYYKSHNYELPCSYVIEYGLGFDNTLPVIFTTTDVTPGSSGSVTTSTYNPNGYNVDASYYAGAIIHYIDQDTNKTVMSDSATGIKGQSSQVDFKAPSGYEFAPNQPKNIDHLFTGEAGDTINVYVTASTQTIPVEYVDDTNNQVVKTDTITGKTGQNYVYGVSVPAKYVLADNQPATLTGTFKSSDNGKLIVHLTHHISKGVTPDSAHKVTVTRTINYKYEDGRTAAPTNNQTLTFSDVQDIDDTTGKVIKDDWGANQDFHDVTSPDIKGYTPNIQVVSNKNIDHTAKDITVNVIYKPNAANVKVRYVDEKTQNDISEPTVLTGKVDGTYTSSPKQITGWHLTKTPANAKGTYAITNNDIVYEYGRDAESAKVYYVDENGAPIVPPVTLSGFYGDKYSTSARTFSGYTLVQVPKNASGVLGIKNDDIVYRYKRNNENALIIHRDRDDNQIAPDESRSGNVNDYYTSTDKPANGYHWSIMPWNATAPFRDKNDTVRYGYDPNKEQATIKYVDANGNELAPSETVNGLYGEKYDFKAKQINGYTAQNAELSGTWDDNTKTLTFTYNPVKVNVKAVFLDEWGKEIKPAQVITGNYKDDYNIKAPAIDGYTLISANQVNGKYDLHNNDVHFIYTKANNPKYLNIKSTTKLGDIYWNIKSSTTIKAEPRKK